MRNKEIIPTTGKNAPRWLIDDTDKMKGMPKPKVNAFVFVSLWAP